MKRVFSFFTALVIIVGISATVAFASVPSSVTLTMNPREATSDEIDDYLSDKKVKKVLTTGIPSGYTLYAIDISQTGLGDWSNVGFDDEPEGFLPAVMTFQLYFGDDYSKIYDNNIALFKSGSIALTANRSEAAKTVTFSYGPYSIGTNHAILEDETIDEGDVFATVFLLINGSATATNVSDQTLIGMSDYNGTTINKIGGKDTVTYMVDNSNMVISPSASFAFAPAAATKYTVTFKNEDGTANIQSNEYDENGTVTAPVVANKAGYTFTGWSESIGGATVTPIATATADKTYYAVFAKDAGVVDPAEDAAANNIGVTGLKDINGEDVPALTKNYGITKFSTILDSAYDYYLIVEDEEGNIKDENSANPFKIDFDAEHIETSGTVSFFALVHSTTHVIKSIVLKAVAKN